MREYKRQSASGLRMRLVRRADGRLRSATEGTGIGDVWAEQKRIRLAEAIKEDQRRKEKRREQKRRIERAKKWAVSAPKRLKTLKLPSKNKKTELKKLLRRLSKRQLVIGGVVAVVVLSLIFILPLLGKDKIPAKDASVTTTKLPKNEKPAYATLLPQGKNIEQLGGWQRVSPPGKDPVFAFVDQINGVQVNVSQQPLPASFKKDLAGSVAKLAEQFTANDKITAEGITAYIGTSEKGPQSVVFAQDNLLVLIKSTERIPNEIWGTYITTLKQR